MPSLQVRELPEQLYNKIKQEAQNKHRTLAQQAIVTLAKGLNVPLDPKKRRENLLMILKQNADSGNIINSKIYHSKFVNQH